MLKTHPDPPAALEPIPLDRAPVAVVHDRFVTPAQVLELERSWRFGASQRHAQRFSIDRSIPALSMVPPSFTVESTYEADHGAGVLASRPGATLLVQSSDGSTTIALLAATAGLLREVREEVDSIIPQDPSDLLGGVVLWRRSSQGNAIHSNQRADLRSWSEIARNYPTPVRSQIDRALDWSPSIGSGRLMLWHGAPGTGKTTAALALLEAWKAWCDGHLITDPERLFDDGSYLLDVVMSECHPTAVASLDRETPPARRWKLIIAEDSEEFLRSDARQKAGAALSRVLNLTDGILARGTRTLLLFTTNEERGRLHPALVRPGRCLSEIEFTPFDAAGARAWASDPTISGPLTLAELYARQNGDNSTPAPTRSSRPGMYL